MTQRGETQIDWAGMDAATAFHMIDRHANGFEEIAQMMEAWAAARPGQTWHLIDTAPKDGTEFLALCEECNEIVQWMFDIAGVDYWQAKDGRRVHPSLWTTIPKRQWTKNDCRY